MKIGLISDIHADLTGLRRALAILKREAVDITLCLGDLVEKGHEGEAVIIMVQALEIPCIQGNHDVDAIENQHWLRVNLDPAHENAQTKYLSDASLAYLKALPFERRHTWEGVRVLAVHGSPWRNTEYLFAHSPQACYQYFAKECAADVILCGHTHEPMHVRASGVHFVNPGSVCADYAHGSGTCAVLTLPEIDFRVFSLGTGQPVVV